MNKRLIATLSLTTLVATATGIPAASAQASGYGHDAKPKTCSDSNPAQGCIAATNSTAGNAVLGVNSSAGVGVLGVNTGSGFGVEALSYGSTENSAALEGLALNGAIGVYAASNTGIGVLGATAGSQYGVYGITGGTGAGVFGVYSSCNCGIGSGFGAVGGVSETPGIPAFYGRVQSANGSPLASFAGGSGGFQTFDDSGNITISGDIYTAGSCNLGCSKTRGILEPAARSTEATLDDQGEATLRNGVAHVALDPAYANAIDAHRSYIVTVTLEGDANEVYVTNRTPSGFDVRETHGGRSTVGFAYRIVAKPQGASHERLAFATLAQRTARALQLPVLPKR